MGVGGGEGMGVYGLPMKVGVGWRWEDERRWDGGGISGVCKNVNRVEKIRHEKFLLNFC